MDARELASIRSSHENALYSKALKSLWDTFTSFGDHAERSKEYMALPPRLQKEAIYIDSPKMGPMDVSCEHSVFLSYGAGADPRPSARNGSVHTYTSFHSYLC